MTRDRRSSGYALVSSLPVSDISANQRPIDSVLCRTSTLGSGGVSCLPGSKPGVSEEAGDILPQVGRQAIVGLGKVFRVKSSKRRP